MKIKNANFVVLKAYIQAQLLLETLDVVEDETKMDIKHSTKKYKKTLEPKVEQVIKNTFNSNKKLFDKIMLSVDNHNSLVKYFEII